MFKLKVFGATRKTSFNSLSSVTLLRYFNNVEIEQPKIDTINSLMSEKYLLKICNW